MNETVYSRLSDRVESNSPKQHAKLTDMRKVSLKFQFQVTDFGDSLSKEIKTNQGVCKGCIRSSPLFNIYPDEILRYRMSKAHPANYLKPTKSLIF